MHSLYQKHNALALINSQEQRIGELEAECEQWRSDWEENQKQWEIAYDKLESENARLTEEKNEVFEKGAENLTRLEEAYLKLEAENLKLTEENERLKAQKYYIHSDGRIEMIPTVESVRADTVREMQERLMAQAITIQDHTGKIGVVVGVGNIGDVAKEMLEGENE